jgi:hypothetical protein
VSGGNQRPQTQSKATPPALSAFSFYIKSTERKSANDIIE